MRRKARGSQRYGYKFRVRARELWGIPEERAIPRNPSLLQGCFPSELPGSVPDPWQLSLVISRQFANLLPHDGVMLSQELLLEPGFLSRQSRLDLGCFPPQGHLQRALRQVLLGEEPLVCPSSVPQVLFQTRHLGLEIIELRDKMKVLGPLILQLLPEILHQNLGFLEVGDEASIPAHLFYQHRLLSR